MHAIIPGLEQKAGQGAKEGGGRKEVRRMLSEVVTEEHVADIISRATGIPLGSLLQGESDRLLKMEETLKESVVGQDQAIKAIANCVRCVFPSLFSLSLFLSFLFLYRAVLFSPSSFKRKGSNNNTHGLPLSLLHSQFPSLLSSLSDSRALAFARTNGL